MNEKRNSTPNGREVRAAMRALGIKEKRFHSAESILMGGMGTVAGVSLLLMSPYLFEHIQMAIDVGFLPGDMNTLKWAFPVAAATSTVLGLAELRGRSTLDEYDRLRAWVHAKKTKEEGK